MEELRRAAGEVLQNSESILDFLPPLTSPAPDTLLPLWNEISPHTAPNYSTTCQDLLVAQAYLKTWGSKPLSDGDEMIASRLYDWASSIALPSSAFANITDLDHVSDEQKKVLRDNRLKSSLAVSVISLLSTTFPIWKASNASDIITTLASFTVIEDPWTVQESFAISAEVLQKFITETSSDKNILFWPLIEEVLKQRVKPLFAKTKNPAITPGGRKNFHPIPLPRFDASTLDPETRPWKNNDVYTTSVFAWIVSLYTPENCDHLELHFPLIVPPLLALIDDESLPFKARGCDLLSQILKPIRETNSDILKRTNLSSVFEDAIKPCLLSLPTITPEHDSIRLLGIAYPTLVSLYQTTYQIPSSPTSPQHAPQTQTQKASQKEPYITSLTTLLRNHLIPSFHHISTTNPSAVSSFASFPHPHLSSLLISQITTLVAELGIHVTKYLQDLVPLIYSTLSNPFGTAHPPLLIEAVKLTRDVILNAHPRIWRWRVEVLGGVCRCWVSVLEEESEGRRRGLTTSGEGEVLRRLKKEMKGVVYLLKVAIEEPAWGLDEPGVMEAKDCFEEEIRVLADADGQLEDLLLDEIDVDDGKYFGIY